MVHEMHGFAWLVSHGWREFELGELLRTKAVYSVGFGFLFFHVVVYFISGIVETNRHPFDL